jgi:membrane protein YdbS with pleckstrin-like domain
MTETDTPISSQFAFTGRKALAWISPFDELAVAIVILIAGLILVMTPFISTTATVVFVAISVFILIRAGVDIGRNVLFRKRFHFSIDENGITVGMIPQEQRRCSYSNIQEVEIKQDRAEKLLHVFSVVVKKKVQDEGSHLAVFQYGYMNMGDLSDKIIFPALKNEDAEKLKNAIVAKLQV